MTPAAANPSVLIVGAGPTGLVLALWLTRLGVTVRIIDKAAEPGTTSRALAVQARTLEFYRQAGFADALVSGGVQIANANLWVKGRRAARVPIGRIGRGLSPYPFALIYPQDRHEHVLLDQLDALGVHVERRVELVRLETGAGGVLATLKRTDGAEETCDAAYLAGCDGASSVVRRELGIGFPGGTYSGLFYVADVEASGPATNMELHADLDDADFLIVFPLRELGRVRLVGNLQRPPGPDELLTFDDVRGRAIEHLKLGVAKVNWFSIYHVHHRVADRFWCGRVFLLGDAAHIHSPVGGQGMNTGIADAVNLAWKLAAVLRDGAEDRLLATYEPERIAFARRLVATTDRMFTLVTSRGGLARFVRTRLVPLLAPPVFRIPALRRFMFRTLSQTVVNYRMSPLSEGRAGAIHGGDRLPWVEMAPGRDNFTPLGLMDWQVHVYGHAREDLSEACSGFRIPLHVFEWNAACRAAGLRRDSMYLIRPDGYVALADEHADAGRLRRWWTANLGIRCVGHSAGAVSVALK
jgi:2-polyprenyl-6-methoxyphenol hydroxylase-like FAD-dependent oxidoreductase